ncbi:MAG TPA: DNA replication/repair protein RecF [Candidatus Sulfomarinibacteraceae bacterium]|nr:DNA replication/repair protein RecF [Candidatus Sulfomarinibacteraceae bacterium]
MHIEHLSLTNFRNYGRLELDFSREATLLYGANAQGKTNLLEAIYYLATTRSHHAIQDNQLLNWDAEQSEDPIVVGRLVAQVQRQDGERLLEMRLIKERQNGNSSFRREALVNRRKVRLMDLLGNLRVVLFLPQDVQMVTGSPSERRRYLDITLCQSDSIYCRTLSRYNKVLEQRNAVLRRMAEEGRGRDMLPVFTEKLVKLGGHIFARRATFLAALAREAQRIHYEELTDGRETLRLRYVPRLYGNNYNNGDGEGRDVEEWAGWLEQATPEESSERFRHALETSASQDIARARTTIGPQRDDWAFVVNGRDLGSFGSRGQQRTAVLALKMAEINWMAEETAETPVLLLDEVVAELDEQRRALLLSYIQRGAQAILTATDPAMFTETFLQEANALHVSNGRISRSDGVTPGATERKLE